MASTGVIVAEEQIELPFGWPRNRIEQGYATLLPRHQWCVDQPWLGVLGHSVSRLTREGRHLSARLLALPMVTPCPLFGSVCSGATVPGTAALRNGAALAIG